jgi:hypothetical protein
MRRLLRWLLGVGGPPPIPVSAEDGGEVERPWLRRWDFLP